MPTAAALLALALLAQIALSIVAMLRAGAARVGAVRARRVRLADIALDTGAWPDDVRKMSNNMQNQFETPTLFYAVGLLALALGMADLAVAVLAWVFVGFRILHMAVHTGSNDVLPRFRMFAAGVACIAVMAVILTLRIVLGMAG
ncbi:MAPEG family protein [Methylobrevis albus]|uniref:MAPEG family protein n=1 Tax=Methylobrevis albus TaxID=2793297 RepID=A0A931I3Z6_9HYPH|nr:MAPEG family protein [Methylobrevis albus]MBH0239014.1 MAPEG family protein [Methylobrevis albus]